MCHHPPQCAQPPCSLPPCSLAADITLALTPSTSKAEIAAACSNANAGKWSYEITAAHAQTKAITTCDAVAGQPGNATCSGLQPNAVYTVSCVSVSDEVTKVTQAAATT